MATKDTEILLTKQTWFEPLSRHKSQPENLWIHLWFCNSNRRNNHRYALSLRTGGFGAKESHFSLFPFVWRQTKVKNVKSSIFRKKTSKFWAVYLLNYKPLIINKNIMMHRQIICLSITYQTSKSNISQISNFQLHFLIKLFLI